MKPKTCSVSECSAPVRCKGLCRLHYSRKLRTGSVELAGQGTPTRDRLERKLVADGECLRWTGHRNDDGYGKIRHGGKMRFVHRVAYELEHGAIPDGVEIDHACHARDCVNVEHLRPATRLQNVRNRAGANKNSSTGHRCIHAWRGGQFRVRVADSNFVRHGSVHKDLQSAIMERDHLLEKLFGEFAGAA